MTPPEPGRGAAIVLDIAAGNRLRVRVTTDLTARVTLVRPGFRPTTAPMPLSSLPGLRAGGWTIRRVAAPDRNMPGWLGVWTATSNGPPRLAVALDMRGLAAAVLCRPIGGAAAAVEQWLGGQASLLGRSSIEGAAARLREARQVLGGDAEALIASAVTEFLHGEVAMGGADGRPATLWHAVVDGLAVTTTGGLSSGSSTRFARLGNAVAAAMQAEAFGVGIDSPRAKQRPVAVGDSWDLADYANAHAENLSWTDPTGDQAVTDANTLGDGELAAEIEQILAKLPRRQGEALRLRVVDGYLPERIAAHMGISRQRVNHLLRAAGNRLAS